MSDGNLLIDDCRYIPDWAAYSRQPLESDVSIQDQGAEPSERSLSRFGWKRSQTDFVLGQGQQWFDQEDENDRRRFFRGRNLTMRERGELTNVPRLPQETDTIGAGARLLPAGIYGLWYEDSSLRLLSNGGDTIQSMTGFSGTALDAAVLAGRIYIANGTNVYRQGTVGATSVSSWSTEDTDALVAGEGRLVGMHDNEVWEFDSSGNRLNGDTIFTHSDTGFSWRGGVKAPNGIYIWGDDGVQSEIFVLVATDATGVFAAPYSVASWPVGELINDIVEYGGLLWIATNRGIRAATISGSGFLSYGPVLEFDGGVPSLDARGDDVFFPINNLDVDGTTYSGVGRLGLKRFTETLVPSWEFYVDDKGNDEVYDCSTIWTSAGVPRLVYTDNDGGNSRIHVEDATVLHDEVEFDTGYITYGTPERKAFLSFELEGDFATATLGVTAYVDRVAYPLDVDVNGRVATCTYDDELVGQEMRIVVTGTLPDTATQFTITRWTLRTLALTEQTEVINVGVILESDATESVVESHDPYADWLRLQTLSVSRKITTLQVGDRCDRGYIDAVIAPEGQIKDVLGRGEEGEFVQGRYVVRFIAAQNA